MWSLVGAPVLGFDLTRMTGGAATAEVLLRGLCLTSTDLPILAERLLPEDTRAQLWLDVEQATRAVPSLKMSPDEPDLSRLLETVEQAPIGNLDGLLRLVRYDVLAWTWSGTGDEKRQDETAAQATALLCDAVVATYLRDQLSPEARRKLGSGWVASVRRLPAPSPIDLGPHHYAVSSLLDRLGTLRQADVARLTRAAEDARAHPGGWPSAVHSASWAAYLSDRVRTAAAAQFLLVQAMDTSAIPVSARAGGVWNLLSGAVQALVVRDLLDTATAHRLLAQVVAALGPAWLS